MISTMNVMMGAALLCALGWIKRSACGCDRGTRLGRDVMALESRVRGAPRRREAGISRSPAGRAGVLVWRPPNRRRRLAVVARVAVVLGGMSQALARQ